MIAFDYIVEKLGSLLSLPLPILRYALMDLIAYCIWRIWTSSSPVGVLLHLILVLLFSLVLLCGMSGLFYMVQREIPLKLLVTLAAVVFVNFCMYFPTLRAGLRRLG